MKPYGTQKQLEKRRRHAVELLKKGYTLSAVAKKLGCSPGSVFLWRQMYRHGGEEAMKPEEEFRKNSGKNSGDRRIPGEFRGEFRGHIT